MGRAGLEPATLRSQELEQPSPTEIPTVSFITTEDSATADLWRAELSAGRLPADSDDP
jgi:hypothetical protein